MGGHTDGHDSTEVAHLEEKNSLSNNLLTTERGSKKKNIEQKQEKTGLLGKVDKYPTYSTYTKYAESLKLSDLRPKYSYLDEYLTSRKISDKLPKTNPFKGLKELSLDELRELTEAQNTAEKQFQKKFPSVSDNLPKQARIHLGVVDTVREIIHKNNLQEICQRNRLLGPSCITFRKAYDGINKSVLYPEELEAIDPKRKIEELSLSEEIEDVSQAASDKEKSLQISGNSGTRGSGSNVYDDELRNYFTFDHSENNKSGSYKMCKPELIKRARYTCLLNLAARTKLAEINRIDKIMEDEKLYLIQREQMLAKRSLAHDEYLKRVCKETADTINAAEEEAVRKKKIADEIKSQKYTLAHLNAECVKLEERCTVLVGYKEFLFDVAMTCVKEKIEAIISKDVIMVRSHLKELLSNKPKFEIGWNELSDDHIENELGMMLSIFKHLYQFPMKLVDLLIELESGNLTLIETVQEQKEMCENYRQKAQALEDATFNTKDTTMLSIESQLESCEKLKREAKEMEDDFRLIEKQLRALKYMREFNVGFENLPPDVHESTLSITEVLNLMHVELGKAHNGVFENIDSSGFSSLEMLKRLEKTSNDMNAELQLYSLDQINYAKKLVAQQKYLEQRKILAQEAALAYQKRMERVMAEARRPPRYHKGRHVVFRSKPPTVYKPPEKGSVDFDIKGD